MTHDTEVTALKACPREPTAEMVEFDALCAILVERKGQEFDGECHLTCAEADRLLSVIALARFALDQLQRAAPAVPVEVAEMHEALRLDALNLEAMADSSGFGLSGYPQAMAVRMREAADMLAALSQQPSPVAGHLDICSGQVGPVADCPVCGTSEGEDDVARANYELAFKALHWDGPAFKLVRERCLAGDEPGWELWPEGRRFDAAVAGVVEGRKAALARAGQDYGRGVRDAALREAARIARDGCLVPPDGGSPTEAERQMCEDIADAILALVDREA